MFASRLNGWFKSLTSTSLALLCIALLTFNANAQSTAVGNATVAAASDLKFAIEEVALQFEKETGYKLKLVFGSSGQFKTQIMQGAPFHLFMSADEKFVYQLADAGKNPRPWPNLRGWPHWHHGATQLVFESGWLIERLGASDTKR